MKRLIAIPAYNEHENILEVILGVSSALNLAGYEADIIVFDDRSTDDTVNIVRSTRIASVETSEARGGYWENVQRAVLAGAKRGYDQIIFMDADGQHDPSNLTKIILDMEMGSNIVVVSRFGSGSKYHMEFSKRVGRSLYRLLLKYLVGYSGQDPTSGNIGMDRTAMEKLVPIARPEIFMDTTLLAWAIASGLVVREVDGLFHDSDQSAIYPNILSAFKTFLCTVLTTISVYNQARRSDAGLKTVLAGSDNDKAVVHSQTSSPGAESAVVRQQEVPLNAIGQTQIVTPGSERG